MPKAAAEKKPTFTPEFVRDISEKVYRASLEDDSKGNVHRMIEKDGDMGEKLRGRAAGYDRLTRFYLAALGIKP